MPGVQEDHPTRPDRRHVPLLPLRREGRVLTHQHRKGEHTPWLEIAERDRHRTRADAGLAVLGAELTVIVDAGRAVLAVLGPEVHDADAAVDLDRVGPCGAASPLLRAPTASRAVAPRATPDDLRASAAPPAKHTHAPDRSLIVSTGRPTWGEFGGHRPDVPGKIAEALSGSSGRARGLAQPGLQLGDPHQRRAQLRPQRLDQPVPLREPLTQLLNRRCPRHREIINLHDGKIKPPCRMRRLTSYVTGSPLRAISRMAAL